MCIGYKKHIVCLVTGAKCGRKGKNRMKMIKKRGVFDEESAQKRWMFEEVGVGYVQWNQLEGEKILFG